METITDRIRFLMKEQDITKKRLADELQVSYSALNNYLGGRRWPNLQLLCKISRCLNTSTDYLLGLSDEKNPTSLPGDERELLTNYRMLPPIGKRYILGGVHQLKQLFRQLDRNLPSAP